MSPDQNKAMAQLRGQTLAGLYRVAPSGDSWHAEHIKDGKLQPQDSFLVIIADSGYETANHAAKALVPSAMEHPDIPWQAVRQAGCSLHFTPGANRLGGLRRYDALTENSSRASALHLANSMFEARNLKVIWGAHWGGSVVLTQAMQILVDRGVALKGHSAYLYKPRTSPGDALGLAHQLNFTLGSIFATTGWSIPGALSQWRVAKRRLRSKNDAYDSADHRQALVNGFTKTAGSISVAVGLLAIMLGTPILKVIWIVLPICYTSQYYSMGKSLVEGLRHKFKR